MSTIKLKFEKKTNRKKCLKYDIIIMNIKL